MKKSFRILLTLAVAATAAVSCAKEMISEMPSPVKLVSVSFVASSDAVKTSFDGAKLSWAEGDSIAVWDGTQVHCFKAASVNGTNAVFCGEVADGAESFAVVYPYSACGNVTATSIDLTLPSSQTIASGANADPASFVCYARTADLSSGVKLVNAVSLVKFSIDIDGIKSVSLIGNGNENICGSATLAQNDSLSNLSSEKLSIFPESDSFARGTYYASIAPTTFSNGVTVSFTTTSIASVLSSSSEAEFPRNGGRDLGAITSNAKTRTLPYTITNADEMVEFGKFSTFYPSDASISVSNDIDMTGKTWPGPAGFSGNFDGGNHTVYNLEVSSPTNCGFFGEVSGTVKNLVFGKAGENDSRFIQSADPSVSGTYNVAPILMLSGKGSLENIVNNAAFGTSTSSNFVAGIVAESSSEGSITNCTNNSSMTNANDMTIGIRMSGIVGKLSGATSITGCTNNGSFSYTGGTSKESIYLGGIVGQATKNGGYLENCKNYGKMSILSTALDNSFACVSGIIGYVYQATLKEIKSCHNYGDLLIDSKSVKVVYLGGIVPRFYQCGTPITSCTNEGSITNKTSYVQAYLGGICGFTAAGKKTDIVSCSNSGAISNSGNSTHGSNTSSDQPDIALGGIIGFANGTFKVEKCSNTGNILNEGNTKTKSNIATMAGIVGGWWDSYTITISECDNAGSVTDKSTPSTSNPILLGGIVGRCASTGTISDCSNRGALLKGGTETKGTVSIGGICASNPTAKVTITKCTNYAGADISVTAVATSVYAGGILGTGAGGAIVEECINNADITQTSNCSSGTYAGGIIGNSSGSALGTFTSCENNGNLLHAGTCAGNFRWGGICGSAEGSKTFKSCKNSGAVTNDSGTIKPISIAGILGYGLSAASTFDGCINSGNISSSTSSGTVATLDMGGIIGQNKNGSVPITDCESYCDITSTIGGTCTTVRIGGVAGYSGGGATISGCKVKANVATTGTGTYTTNNSAVIQGASGSSPLIEKTGYAGSINGTAITAANWATYEYICNKPTGTSKINISGDANSIYFLSE